MSQITASSSSIRTDYLQLLITQLQNQNPLEPVDNDQLTSQLTAISQLEQLENMTGILSGQADQQGSTFSKVLEAVQKDQAANLIGKQITFFTNDGTNPASGKVEAVAFEDGQPQLILVDVTQEVDGETVDLKDQMLHPDGVLSIQNLED